MRQPALHHNGFTIIEILIVLAIAGFIVIIVFFAVPQLQRNQRNTTRNSEGSRIAAAVRECLANRNNDKTACDTDAEISVGALRQLSVETTTFTDSSTTTSTGYSTSTATVDFQRACNASGSDSVAGSIREFVVMYQLEPTITKCIQA